MRAIAPMSAAPTDDVRGSRGWTPALSRAASDRATAGLAPEPPRVSPISRTAMAARATSVGTGGPNPPEWVRTIMYCWATSASSGTRTSLLCPTPVVSP